MTSIEGKKFILEEMKATVIEIGSGISQKNI